VERMGKLRRHANCSGETEELKLGGSLLTFRPHSYLTVFADLHMNDVGMAADRAVLNIFLARPRCHVERDDNLLAA
jgi:hypothetical protein